MHKFRMTLTCSLTSTSLDYLHVKPAQLLCQSPELMQASPHCRCGPNALFHMSRGHLCSMQFRLGKLQWMLFAARCVHVMAADPVALVSNSASTPCIISLMVHRSHWPYLHTAQCALAFHLVAMLD